MFQSDSLKKLTAFFTHHNPIEFEKGEIILQADDLSSDIFYIESGFVKVYRIAESGEELTLFILKPEDIFPQVINSVGLPNLYYFEALTNLSVRRTPKETLMNFLKKEPELFYDLTDHFLTRFGGLLTRMEYLLLNSAHTKVVTTLLICASNLGEKSGGDVVVKIPLTHKDIANLTGITRETTCLEMKKLERMGLVKRLGRLLVVRDMKRLEKETLLADHERFLLNNSL